VRIWRIPDQVALVLRRRRADATPNSHTDTRAHARADSRPDAASDAAANARADADARTHGGSDGATHARGHGHADRDAPARGHGCSCPDGIGVRPARPNPVRVDAGRDGNRRPADRQPERRARP
jgi:hypothetical protein